MKLSDQEKNLLRVSLGCRPGQELEGYLTLVQSVRPWLRPIVGWWRFGRMETEELLKAYLAGPEAYKEANA